VPEEGAGGPAEEISRDMASSLLEVSRSDPPISHPTEEQRQCQEGVPPYFQDLGLFFGATAGPELGPASPDWDSRAPRVMASEVVTAR
jgi:hypothetical protein